MAQPSTDLQAATCIAPTSSTTRCGAPSAATIKFPVPGGTIKGNSCLRHIDYVRSIVRDAAALRGGAANGDKATMVQATVRSVS